VGGFKVYLCHAYLKYRRRGLGTQVERRQHQQGCDKRVEWGGRGRVDPALKTPKKKTRGNQRKGWSWLSVKRSLTF